MTKAFYLHKMTNDASFNGFSLSLTHDFFSWLKEKTSSQNFIAFSLVLALHLSMFAALIYKFQNEINAPLVSFSVSLIDDISASQTNMVASEASSASHSHQEQILDSNKKTATNDETQNKSNESFDSLKQNAVIAKATPARFDAAYLNNPSPTYPALSRRLNEQGKVLLEVFVDENGATKNVAIKKSSGFERLDNSALETVKKWRFVSAKEGEKSVSSSVLVPIEFILEK